jgi:hypothetical protein
VFWSTFTVAIPLGEPEAVGAGFFKMPRRPGSGTSFDSPAFAPLAIVAPGNDAVPPLVFRGDISWIRGPGVGCTGFALDGGAPVRAGSIAAGTCTERGRSLPLLAILGVPIFRDSTRRVWASMRCSASSIA